MAGQNIECLYCETDCKKCADKKLVEDIKKLKKGTHVLVPREALLNLVNNTLDDQERWHWGQYL